MLGKVFLRNLEKLSSFREAFLFQKLCTPSSLRSSHRRRFHLKFDQAAEQISIRSLEKLLPKVLESLYQKSGHAFIISSGTLCSAAWKCFKVMSQKRGNTAFLSWKSFLSEAWIISKICMRQSQLLRKNLLFFRKVQKAHRIRKKLLEYFWENCFLKFVKTSPSGIENILLDFWNKNWTRIEQELDKS